MKSLYMMALVLLVACGLPDGPILEDTSCSLPDNQKVLLKQSAVVTYDLDFTINDFPSTPKVTYFFSSQIGPIDYMEPDTFTYKVGQPSLLRLSFSPQDPVGTWFIHATITQQNGYQRTCSESFTLKDGRL